MKDRIKRLFQGRYGSDELNLFLLGLAIFLQVLGRITTREFFIFLGYIPLIMSLFRLMSKRIYKRQAENMKFKYKFKEIEKQLDILKMKFEDRKDYKYFKCPVCKTHIRIPRKKGRLRIKCPKCETKFEGRT